MNNDPLGKTIKWEEVLNDGNNEFLEIADMCECPLNDTRCTLRIEEGQAELIHVTCGKRLWLEPEDIFAEIPVDVTIEDCGNPGGWHGMERCDHGPEVSIEHVKEDIR